MTPDDQASQAAGPAAPATSTSVERVWQGWQRALAETGGPNTLLWQAGTASDGAGQAALLDLTTAHPGGLSMLLAGRPTPLSGLVREPSAFVAALTLARAVRSHADDLARDRGLSTCYLGAGAATWEQRGQTPRAPVLLRACSLRPTDLTGSDFVIDASPSVELNPALAELLRSHGVDVDEAEIAGLATAASGFDPYPVYGVLGRLGAGLPGFAVTPRLVVGTFPHSKLAMVSDVRGLVERASVGGGGAATVAEQLATWLAEPAQVAVPEIAPPADADPDPDPARELLVLDADADQAHIVQTVLRGQGVVVEAPPQTGTTQTIAALVAALAASGRSVLLLSQRHRDLVEAIERLARVGLGDLVVQADEGAVSRLADLVQRTRAGSAASVPDAGKAGAAEGGRAGGLDRLRDQRAALRDHVESLHRRRAPWQVSAFEAQRAVLDLQSHDPRPTSNVRIDSAPLSRLTRDRVGELAGQLEAAVEAGAWEPGQGDDPWFGARIETEEDVARAEAAVGRLTSGTFDVAARTLDSVLAESQLPPATSVSDWSRAVETMSGVSETLEVFRPEVFDMPLDEHVAATASRGQRDAGDPDLGWLAGSRVRRHARSLLRPGRPPADLHAELVRARDQRVAWQALVGAGGRPEISPRLDEAQEALSTLDADLTWLESVLRNTAQGGDLRSVPFDDVHARLTALAERRDRLRVLPQVVPVVDALREAGMGKVVADFAARGVPADQVRTELSHIWWGSITREVAASDSGYGRFDGSGLHASAAAFVAADEAHLAARAARVGQVVAARRAEVLAASPAAAGRLGSLAEGLSALRSLFESSPELLGLAPCWAASPYVVAEAFPSSVRFDVVVVDGASQLPTAAAVPALARASVVVAFGDEKQAPPTGFVVGGLDDSGVEGVEGSLFCDLSRGLPSWRLRWVHGVADERVVEFANREVYGGELVTVPSAWLSPAVTLRMVDGRARVDAGSGAGSGAESAIESTEAEVAEVVSLVLDHARIRPGESLAVVAVTAVHARRIQEALTAARAAMSGEDAVLDALFGPGEASQSEPFVVVDLAHAAVGGYDAAVLTVGYGKTTHGGMLHRFPELADPSARRRLTSALTVARRRLTVVSSISGSDLDPERLEPGGVMLRDLLLQLGGQGADADSDDGASTVSQDPLMADLAARLRREGLAVDEAVGVGGRVVELAVRDPREEDSGGRYVVAVDADGEAYASLLGSRTRDRLWPQALERRGWRAVRVWSTDLFRDPAREVSRIVGLVREATGGAVSGAAPTPAPAEAASADGVGTGGSDGSGASDAGDTAGASGTSRAAGQGKKVRGIRKLRRPEQTKDDTDLGWGERPDSSDHDQWLEEQRPPHWD